MPAVAAWKAQLRVAPLLVVERQRRAAGIEYPQQARQPAAGLLGTDAGIERLAFLQRHRVKIDFVGDGQKVRHLGVVERAEMQRHGRSRGEVASSVRSSSQSPSGSHEGHRRRGWPRIAQIRRRKRMNYFRWDSSASNLDE